MPTADATWTSARNLSSPISVASIRAMSPPSSSKPIGSARSQVAVVFSGCARAKPICTEREVAAELERDSGTDHSPRANRRFRMSGRSITLLAIGFTATATATAMVAVIATKPGRIVAPQGSRVCAWQAAPAEDPHRALFDRFTSVVVVNRHEAWATGDFFTGEEGGRSGAFMERWDGRSWRLVEAPVPPGSDLHSVSASSRADAWAAGAAGGGQLIEHWDGKRWEKVTAPRVRGGLPFAIASLAPDNVWAVGVAKSARGLRTLTEHWDGTRWTVVPSPNPASAAGGRFAILLAVTATSSTDVWAAGYRGRTGSNVSRTLIEHWDGRRWTIIPSPNTRAPNGVVNNILFSISSAREDDVWAVGSWGGLAGGYGGTGDHALALQWDGSRWSRITMPTQDGRSLLSSVVVLGEQVWAVGDQGVGPRRRPLILRLDGARFAAVAAPPGFDLRSISADQSGKNLWAVGSSSTKPLAARCAP